MKEPIDVAVICTALLALLVFGLGFAVSLARAASKTAIGHGNDPTDRLYKLVRAHANACEYAPMLGLLMLLLGSRDPGTWIPWVFVAATGFRYLHAAGMIFPSTLGEANPLRFVGALGTYVTGLLLAVATLLSVGV